MGRYKGNWDLNKICSTATFSSDVPNVTLDVKKDKAHVVIFSDVHIGADAFNLELFEKYLKKVKALDAYIILAGDILEFAVPTHIPESMFEQVLTPQQQYEYARDLLSDFKENIIFACSGNHEWRSYKKTGVDISKQLAESLGCFYSPSGGYVVMRVGKQEYKFAVYHGSSGGQVNIWAELEKRWAVVHDADLVAAGHIHHLAHKAIPKIRLRDGKETRDYVHFVRTGSFITEPLYSQMAMYSPTLDGAPIISLDSKRHFIQVDVTGEVDNG